MNIQCLFNAVGRERARRARIALCDAQPVPRLHRRLACVVPVGPQLLIAIAFVIVIAIAIVIVIVIAIPSK